MDNDRGIPKTGIPFAVQMVREKIGALRVMPTRSCWQSACRQEQDL